MRIKNNGRLVKRLFRASERLTGVTEKELTGRTRGTKAVSHTRKVIYMILKNKGLSYHEIGEELNRDHSSVVHGVRTFKFLPDEYKELYNKLEREINGSTTYKIWSALLRMFKFRCCRRIC